MIQNARLPLQVLTDIPLMDKAAANRLLIQELALCGKKVVVLDDDPTGTQTIHDIPVYTNWRPDTLLRAFHESGRIFFILTNSRGMTVPQTIQAHRDISAAIDKAARASGKNFILISRSDSTLRGHYPLETALLRSELEALGQPPFDGEILYPFFPEGGRFTIGGIHYVQEGDELVPVGQTEFAQDRSFGYHSSDLAKWCEEKSGGTCRADQVSRVTLEDLRTQNHAKIAKQLVDIHDFGKVIVDSTSYTDGKVFAAALLSAIRQGKRFLLRSAAALPKILGDMPDRPFLTRQELVSTKNPNGGIILIGSHVSKTTQQMEELKHCRYPLEFIEFNQHLVLKEGGLEQEARRVTALTQERLSAGHSVVIYTRRERLDLPDAEADRQLEISVRISAAVTSVVGALSIRPSFIIAKGGITSSDVATKALRVCRAVVLGQIRAGIPVWMTGPESKFPNMPYIIFPGNVGERTTLREVADVLLSET